VTNLDLRFTYVGSNWMAALIVLAAMGVTVILYRRAFRGRLAPLPLVLAALRALACGACVLVLLRPVVSYDRIVRKESRLAILIDRSRSMGIADSVGGEARIASALRVARSEAVARLGEAIRLETYVFPGGEEVPAPGVPDIAADGPRTDILSAWRCIKVGAEKLQGIILLSDGRDNRPERLRSADGLPPAPLYAVGVGSGSEGAPDLSIAAVESEEKVLLGNRIEVRAKVRSRGLPPIATILEVSLEGRKVLEREVRLEPGTNDIPFSIAPDRSGDLTYEVRIAGRPDEVFRENNVRHLPVSASERMLQVLIHDGRVRWQYRFVRETLARDPGINAVGLVKTRGDRVLQQGAAPVDLSGGLPSTREEWRKIDVLVLGDVAPGDLPRGAPELIRAWIGEDGGGLIYLGGPESYGAMAASPLAGALPIELRSGGKLPGKPSVSLAAAAAEHPILRGIAGHFLPACPGGPFGVQEAFDAGGPRPGADPLLLVRMAEEAGGDAAPAAPPGPPRILLAAQQYGRGRTIAYLTDSDWRWVMVRGAEGGRTLHARLWGQMARWVARRDDAGADGTLSVRLPRRVAMAGDRVRVEARGPRDRLGKIEVEAVGPGGKVAPVAGAVEGDVWMGEFVPEEEGPYEVRARSDGGAAEGAAPAGSPKPAGGKAAAPGGDPSKAALLVEPDRLEMEEPSPDWDLLRDLAARSGGKFFSLPEANRLADAILRDAGSVATRVELGTERSPWLFAAIVVLLALEWALRRKIFVV
jgi:hypothetical protein